VSRAGIALVLAVAVAAGGCGGGTEGTDSEPAPVSSANSSEQSGGAERSIEEFGTEASGSDRAGLLASFRGYLDALAAREYASACSRLSAGVQRSLNQLLPKSQRAGVCSAALPRLLSPTASAVARSQARGTVTKVRMQGDRGFVVYHAPGAKLYQMPMSREGGAWKLGLVTGSVLVPSAETLGQ
jgi:hypothetical protein